MSSTKNIYMGCGRSWILAVTLIFVFLLSTLSVSAVEVIKREKPLEAPTGNIMSPMQGVFDFLMAWWLPLLIVGILFIGMMWFLNWWKTQKEKENIFLLDYVRTKALCKHQANKKRVDEKPFWIYLLAFGIFISVLLFVIALITDDISSFLLAIGIGMVSLIVSGLLKFSKLFDSILQN